MSEIKKLKINGVTYDLGGSGFDIHSLTAENELADGDEMPFYDVSKKNAPRKTTWGNFKAKLKSYFDTLYLGTTALVGYATQVWVQSQGYGTYSKPSGGIPKTDLASAVQTSLGKADSALQEHQSLADYSTTAQMNAAISAHHDSAKQDVISDLATIRSGAALGATALQAVPNTYRTSAAQDVIDNGKVDKVTGKGLSTNDYTNADKAKVASAVQPSDLDDYIPKVLGDLDGGHTIADSDYIPMAEAPDGDAQKVYVQDFRQYINNGMASQSDLADYALKTDLDELQKTALTATVTIAVADWDGGTTVTKNVTGVTASNIVICDSSNADVQCTAQGAGTLTFTATATPSAEVTVKVVILP